MSPPSEEFALFYRRHWQPISRWAAVICGSVSDGEDIAQDAFLRIRDRYDQLDDPAAYLRKAIVNLSRNQHRATTRRDAREARASRLQHNAPRGPDDVTDGEIVAALRQLSFDQRVAVALRYWAGWTDDEIADTLGCRPATVRSHLKRGLSRLVPILESHR